MPNKFDTNAMRELRAVFNEADALTQRPELTKSEEARINVLLAKIAALRQGMNVQNDAARIWMRDFIKGKEGMEQRANELEGTQTISWTQQAQGGALVPFEFHNAIIIGAAQFDPLLDENVVTVIKSNGFNLRPFGVPGWDLSTVAATKVAEGAQQNPGTVPAAVQAQLGGYTYRQTLAASFELEDDDFQPTINQIEAAYAIAFGRGIGSDLVNGNGTSAPQGVLTGAVSSNVANATAGILVANEIEKIYFAVDAVYRASKKAAWLMNDSTYLIVRNAVDNQGRPLVSVVEDKVILMGKPVYITPSLPSAGGTGNKAIVFGDLSHYVVRVSRSIVKRNLQAAGYVDKGLGLYTGLMRADAKLIDPTGGNKPPIVYALVK